MGQGFLYSLHVARLTKDIGTPNCQIAVDMVKGQKFLVHPSSEIYVVFGKNVRFL
jgi:hypothetical protein